MFAGHKGGLQYLTFTCPDISNVVQQMYWAGFPTDRRSTSSYCVFFGDNLRPSKQQHTLSRSSIEVKYRGVDNAVAQTAWLRNLL
ncbi:ribonuclease H-like domain-containing protein [Tanacetum coccineum]